MKINGTSTKYTISSSSKENAQDVQLRRGGQQVCLSVASVQRSVGVTKMKIDSRVAEQIESDRKAHQAW